MTRPLSALAMLFSALAMLIPILPVLLPILLMVITLLLVLLNIALCMPVMLTPLPVSFLLLPVMAVHLRLRVLTRFHMVWRLGIAMIACRLPWPKKVKIAEVVSGWGSSSAGAVVRLNRRGVIGEWGVGRRG